MNRRTSHSITGKITCRVSLTASVNRSRVNTIINSPATSHGMDHCIDLTFGSGVQNTALVVITYKTFLAPKHNWNSANPYRPQFCCSGSSNDPKPRAYLPEFLSQGHEVTSHEVTRSQGHEDGHVMAHSLTLSSSDPLISCDEIYHHSLHPVLFAEIFRVSLLCKGVSRGGKSCFFFLSNFSLLCGPISNIMTCVRQPEMLCYE